MSFGFSVGDFLATYQLANKVRKEFNGAPAQFKYLSEEVRNLSIILQDSECAFESNEGYSLEQYGERLKQITDNCQSLLHELVQTLDKYRDLEETGPKRDTSAKQKARRVWKRLTFDPEDVGNLRIQIRSKVAALTSYNSQVTVANTKSLLQHQEWQRFRDSLQWLTKTDFASQHRYNLGRRQPGTGSWFLKSEEYQTWVLIEKKTFFCPGIPGAGKTTIAAIVINDLQSRIESDSSIGLAFVYCDFRSNQSLETLLESLLGQLCRNGCSDAVYNLYCIHEHRNTRPSVNELLANLRDAIASYSRVFIVVDAIDEFSSDNGLRTKFLKAVMQLQEGGLSILVTSRHIPSVEKLFEEKGCIRLEIEGKSEDISAYVDAQAEELPDFVRKSPSILDDIKTAILKATNGMFLLATLYLGSLKGETTPRGIHDALKGLPSGSETLMYDFAYEATMRRIQGQLQGHVNLAMRVLTWVTSTNEPFKIEEITDALAVEPNDQFFDVDRRPQLNDIVSVCAGLITVDAGILRLVHYTTQEYFTRTRDEWFPTADLDITVACLKYISFLELESCSCVGEMGVIDSTCHLHDFEKHPFSTFSIREWGTFASRAAESPQKEVLMQLSRCLTAFQAVPGAVEASRLLLYFVMDSEYDVEYPSPPKWRQHISFPHHLRMGWHPVSRAWMVRESAYPTHRIKDLLLVPPTWLHVSAFFGFPRSISSLHVSSFDVNAVDGLGRTALHYAAIMGHESAVDLLLDSKQHLKLNARDYLGATALWWSVSSSRFSVTKLLLQLTSVDVTLSGGHESYTPIQLAFYRNDAIFLRLVLESGKVDVNLPIDGTSTMLENAIIFRRPDTIFKLLVDYGAHYPDEMVPLLKPSVLQALRASQDDIIKSIVEIDACESIADRCDIFTANSFWKALRLGDNTMIQTLQECGADLNLGKGHDKHNLLLQAVLDQDEIAIGLLLSNGMDVNTTSDVSAYTPLLRAVEDGHENIVKLLLANGADINQEGGPQREVPLLCSVKHPRPNMTKLLLENGADVERGSSLAKETPLHGAAFSGNVAIVELLLQYGADVNRVSPCESPLIAAILVGRLALIELLLEKGANPNEDCTHRDRREWASSLWRYKDFAEQTRFYSSGNGTDLFSELSDGEISSQLTPTMLDTPSLQSVKSLQSVEGPETLEGFSLCTPLICTIVLGRNPNLRATLSAACSHKLRGQPRTSIPRLYREQLQSEIAGDAADLASPRRGTYEDGGQAIVKLLVEHGADINKSDAQGRTALDVALAVGEQEEIANFLLSRGATRGSPRLSLEDSLTEPPEGDEVSNDHQRRGLGIAMDETWRQVDGNDDV